MRIVGFVPARGGSERTPNKNISELDGVPLFLCAANNLNKILDKKDIYVDSDSDLILEKADKCGFQCIKRPDDLATNATDGNKFMLWEVSNVEADVYIQHLPPMPFLKKETLNRALENVLNEKYDSAVGVIKEKFYLWSNNTPCYDKLNIPNSFELNDTIIEGMGIYITTKESILNNKTRFGNKPYLIELNKYESIDIDYPTDLEFAKSVMKGLNDNSEYKDGLNEIKIKLNE